jgi:hypothetical protein
MLLLVQFVVRGQDGAFDRFELFVGRIFLGDGIFQVSDELDVLDVQARQGLPFVGGQTELFVYDGRWGIVYDPFFGVRLYYSSFIWSNLGSK